jgi:tetratricopeptide (TPR) repeat protein
VLVRDAAYRAAPKRLRAELHERYADRLDGTLPDLPELDEFVGYHLEQAYRLRAELGAAGRRVEGLAESAGLRLGSAGVRALKRGDMPATITLLERAIALLSPGVDLRHEYMCELGIAQNAAGDADASRSTFGEAIERATSAGQRRVELRARVEAAYARLLSEPEGAARELLAIAEDAVPTFEALGDDRSLARTWLLIGYVQGGIHGDHSAWLEAEERALGYYVGAGFPPATCVGQMAAAIYWGPMPVSSGIERCTDLLGDEWIGLSGRAAVISYLGGLEAQVGRFDRARSLIAEAEHAYRELGAENSAMTTCGTVRADVELLAADLDAAEATLREQCAFFERIHDLSHLAVRAAKLAETIYRQGRPDDAADWVRVARNSAASDDQSAQLILGSVEAKLLARGGAISRALQLAEEVVRLADGTDGLNQIAAARLALSDVLHAANLPGEAQRTTREALMLFEKKGNLVGAARVREMLGAPQPA